MMVDFFRSFHYPSVNLLLRWKGIAGIGHEMPGIPSNWELRKQTEKKTTGNNKGSACSIPRRLPSCAIFSRCHEKWRKQEKIIAFRTDCRVLVPRRGQDFLQWLGDSLDCLSDGRHSLSSNRVSCAYLKYANLIEVFDAFRARPDTGCD